MVMANHRLKSNWRPRKRPVRKLRSPNSTTKTPRKRTATEIQRSPKKPTQVTPRSLLHQRSVDQVAPRNPKSKRGKKRRQQNLKPVQAVRRKYHKGHVQRLRLFVLVTAIRFLVGRLTIDHCYSK
ncbi:hypothetical protein P167DRAFT_369052 [Morchella conica CCBAS932]|uniref:Uncharacterized protein n=1 Tax=Morchella conica CCBAS932 TaxID=1392247 RepID=A0A3N4KQH1_9PEZI|nr:hypothetical protein P167DRAFT_369052 [Morchella conica CCBAS932]